MRHRRTFLAAAVVASLIARNASGEPNPCPDPGCHVKSESTLTTVKGSVLKLPPGYFLDEPTWSKRDAELKLAQDLNTRLKAENESFRKDADKFSWTPVITGVLGVASVVLLHYL